MVDGVSGLNRDPVHKQISETSWKLKQKYGGDDEESMKLAIKKSNHLIHKAMITESDFEEDDMESNTEDNLKPSFLLDFMNSVDALYMPIGNVSN